ncbi:hypothetical protein SNL152K_10202 [Streptomyces sp. NL15-2K]|nr:hypothetical protein SNL152K_10202 [Streptomyces sp. NL15-2K]
MLAIAAVVGLTVMAGIRGLRLARSTSDFFVASRTVRPWWNAAAIGGEYLAAASFLGVAGLFAGGDDQALWLVIGYTGGYLVLLLFIAAPLRRSNGYTLSDFAQVRFDSMAARRAVSVVVVIVCGAYIVPQLHGAGLVATTVLGAPRWAGPVLVATVVGLTVASGGMRSITLVQGMQYLIKVASLLVPLAFIVATLAARGFTPARVPTPPAELSTRSPYGTVSLLISLLLGAAALPHVLLRLATSPDGRSAQRTVVIATALVGTFYAIPFAYGAIGRWAVPQVVADGGADSLVLVLPYFVGGPFREVLVAMVAAGAFGAFIATSSGLVITMAGVVSQDLFGSDVRRFRLSALYATGLPLVLALVTASQSITDTVGYVFAFSASTLFPVLVLGIWWRGATAAAAVSGITVGAGLVAGAAVAYYVLGRPVGALGDLLAHPAAVTVPLVFTVVVVVSRLKPVGVRAAEQFIHQIHRPDDVETRLAVPVRTQR